MLLGFSYCLDPTSISNHLLVMVMMVANSIMIPELTIAPNSMGLLYISICHWSPGVTLGHLGGSLLGCRSWSNSDGCRSQFSIFFEATWVKKTILGFLWIVSHDFSGITAISSELQRASPGNRSGLRWHHCGVQVLPGSDGAHDS